MPLPRWASWTSTAPGEQEPVHSSAAPVSEAAGGSGGMLSYFQQGLSSYVPLRSAERTNEEEAYLSLSHWDRYVCMH